MPLFIIFILGAVILGTGALLAPAWPTEHPRIGLAAALALGIVIGGAVFWAMLFGWNTLVVDYLLFALVTAIFLGGTLTYGQKRAEERGLVIGEYDEGWTSARDLALFALAACIFIIPALILPVPLDTDAQGFGYLALMARLGGDFQSLAPFRPEISYLYSPGFTAFTAYLSQQLGQGLHHVQFAVGAVLSILIVWLAYDFGAELRGKPLGRAMAVSMLFGAGLFTAYMDSHYTTLLALVFAFAFLIYALRYLRDGRAADAVGAGLMLGATAISHPDTTIILGLGFVPWLATMWLGRPRPTLRRWLVLAGGIPLLALVAVSPWVLNSLHLLGADIVSPFELDPNHWRVMVLYHGVWIVPVALVGAVIGLRERSQTAILAVGWLALVLDFSTTGVLARLFPGLLAPVLRYDYPFSIAWHGPIIPYSILGGVGLLWLWEHFLEPRLGAALHRTAPALLGGGIVIALALLVFNQQVLAFSKGRVGFFGAFSSHADVAAMDWIRENTPPDARLLNYPGPHEADWVPVIAERDSVYFRMQPFFQHDEAAEREQAAMLQFWQDPANPANARLLEEAGIAYVIVPQVIANPTTIDSMFRWRAPFTSTVDMQSQVEAAPYLDKVFDEDGAQVFAVVNGQNDQG